MSVHCIRCGRAMKAATPTGLGRVCAKRVPAPPAYERDLLGFDLDAAVDAARERIAVAIDEATRGARIATRQAFRQARDRAGVLA